MREGITALQRYEEARAELDRELVLLNGRRTDLAAQLASVENEIAAIQKIVHGYAPGLVLPAWEEKLDGLANLPPNWNSYNARPIDPRAVESVRRWLRSPSLAPTGNGGLLITVGDANVWVKPDGTIEQDDEPPAPTTGERVEAIWKGLRGGDVDPNRCKCANEPDNYPGTPHRHYGEPPHACARCKCAAYDPAIPTVPATEGGDACPGCNGPIEQENIDLGCRVVTQAGVQGVRCSKSGAFYPPPQSPSHPAPPEAAKVPTHGEALEAVGVLRRSMYAKDRQDAQRDLQRYISANEVRDRAAQQPPVAEGGTMRERACQFTSEYTQSVCSEFHCEACSSLFALLQATAREARAAAEGGAWDTWTPTSDNINALPERLRSFVHDVETSCDPGFLTRENVLLKDQIRALEAAVVEARAAALPDGAREALREFRQFAYGYRLQAVAALEDKNFNAAARLLRALAGTTLPGTTED